MVEPCAYLFKSQLVNWGMKISVDAGGGDDDDNNEDDNNAYDSDSDFSHSVLDNHDNLMVSQKKKHHFVLGTKLPLEAFT